MTDNIAIVVLDTVRKDIFDQHFNWLPGVRYEQAWAPSHYTVPVHAAMFTGKYASEIGVHAKSETFDCPEVSIAQSLSEDGYQTRAFSANPLLSSYTGFDRGFDQFEEGWRVKASDPEIFDWEQALNNSLTSKLQYPQAALSCLLSDSPTISSLKMAYNKKFSNQDGVETALELVKKWKFGEREFLFMNLMEAHSPYEPPKQFRTVDISENAPDKESILQGNADYTAHQQAYGDSARYLSHMYEKIFGEIKSDFDYIITVSDHGELFGEHGVYGHFYGVYPELTHVPMSIYSGDQKKEYRSEVVNHIDIHKTICDIADLSIDSKGRDIRDEIKPQPLLSEYHGLRDGRLKRLHNENHSAAEIEKHDKSLNAIISPQHTYGYETIDGFRYNGGEPEENLQELMNGMIENLDKRSMCSNTNSELSSNSQQQLKDLGYL